MTIEEAIKNLEYEVEKCHEECEGACREVENNKCMCGDAVILDEFVNMSLNVIQLKEIIKQIKWERDIAIKQLEEIGISLGGKMNNIKEAVNKSKPMKIVYKSDVIYNDGFSKYKEGYCPNCGEIYKDIEDYPYRHWCGQRLEI